MNESKFAHILEDARKYYADNPSHIDFSNRFFSQGSKYMQDLKTKEDRREFTHSFEYLEIQEMAHQLEADQREYSGKINIRIPKTLHKNLAEEAASEGTSLNQLIVAKLSRPL